MSATLPAGYFDALYHADEDPWGFETSAYEAEKYQATLAAMPRTTYASGFEIGCSIGVLTAQLAKRCTTLLSVDIAAIPLTRARARNRNAANVEFAQMSFPRDLPDRHFDLIVLSEVLYYFDLGDIALAAAATAGLAAPGAEILLVHWLGPTPDYPLTGNVAVEAFLEAISPFAQRCAHAATPQYRIDRLQLIA